MADATSRSPFQRVWKDFDVQHLMHICRSGNEAALANLKSLEIEAIGRDAKYINVAIKGGAPIHFLEKLTALGAAWEDEIECALHAIADKGRHELVELAMQHCKDIDRFREFRTPACYAFECANEINDAHYLTLVALLAAGASPDARVPGGFSLASLARMTMKIMDYRDLDMLGQALLAAQALRNEKAGDGLIGHSARRVRI